ncbi:CPBP family intramembrane glutamic endopeptidase [Lentilactobacillus raoultii]|uniref:CPBP family intramembrane glutamic endopeptidase n=1 Tax=Lentilactobacillus raoultii TaxID=1987503 RepID=A0ABW3PIC1_9LACO|nr:CPBP family intramembrane glutamic endopeptidase [Lentilactobacillus raoultii]
MQRQWSGKQLYINYLIFWVIWLIAQTYLTTIQTRYTTGVVNDLIDISVKAAIWLPLGIFWLNRTQSQLWLSKKHLYNRRFPAVFWWLLVGMTGYLFISMILKHHGLYMTAHPFTKAGGNFLSVALAAGLIEEFVFRGFFCNYLLAHSGVVKAIVIQALLFQAIHFPIYWAQELSWRGWLSGIASVLPLGLIFGWLFYRSKNLWPGTILHCVWDSAIFLFV